MGNCLALWENVIKTNRKIMKNRAPIRTYRVNSGFPGCASPDKLPVSQHLQPDVNQQFARHCAPPSELKIASKKKVRFSIPKMQIDQGTSVVRIKLLIRKHEFEKILQIERSSINKRISNQFKLSEKDNEGAEILVDTNCEGMKTPVHHIIPEIN